MKLTDETLARDTLRANYAEMRAMRDDGDAIRAGLFQMASSLLPEPTGVGDVLSLYRSLGGEDASHPDFAALCAAAAKERTLRLPEPEPDDEPEPPPHVLTLRGADAEAATGILIRGSGLLPVIGSSASEICDTVADGGARYCVLPLYSSTDGVLAHFRRLAEQAELRVTAVCDISSRDSGATIRYALLARQKPQFTGNKRFLEIVLSAGDPAPLANLPESLRLCGATVKSSFSLPPATDGAEDRCEMTLDVSDASLAALRLYLGGAFPEAEAVGYYDVAGENR